MSSVLQREEGVSYIGLYDKGVECMRRNQVEEAISFFTEAIQHCPMFNYYGDRAKAYLSKGDSTSLLLSLRDCESVLSHHEILNARNAEIDLLGIHITAIKALLALHAPSIAEKYCKRAMESFAASVELQELEGEIEREKGEKEGGKEKKGSEEEEMEDEEEEIPTRRRQEEEEDNLFSQISLPLLLQQNKVHTKFAKAYDGHVNVRTVKNVGFFGPNVCFQQIICKSKFFRLNASFLSNKPPGRVCGERE